MFGKLTLSLGLLGAALASTPSLADEMGAAPILDGHFSFNQPLGQIDIAAAQRGLQIYKEVCSACHALVEMNYQDLAGLGYNEDQIRAFAAENQVADIKDDGTPTERPAKPSDRFVHPFPNEAAARAANGGAAPPDLALVVNARKGGADYVYSILQGFVDPPAGFKLANGMNYNKYFATGNQQIAMPMPLQDGSVTFADGSKNDLEHEAHDVATFLEWASNPDLNARKEMGVKVMIFVVVLAVVLYFAKRRIWRDVH